MNVVNEAVAEQTFLSGIVSRLKRRKLLIVIMSVTLLIVLVLAIETLPKSYRATASVVIDTQTPVATQTGDVMRDQAFDDQTVATELALLQSQELLVDTINRLGLLSKPEFNRSLRPPSWQGKMLANLRQSLDEWITPETEVVISADEKTQAETLETLRRHLVLAPRPRSRVIDIAVTANNNKLASQIANTIADLYITNHRDYKLAASRKAKEFLSERIGDLKSDADRKSEALEQYRIANGLTVAMTTTLVQEQVSGINNQLQTARAKLADLEGQAATVRAGNALEMAAVLASPTITKLREQEGTLSAERARLTASFGEGSPMLSRVNSQLSTIERQIAAEGKRAEASLTNDVKSARANVESLTKRLTDLQRQASITDNARARLTTLTADADSARSLYNEFRTRLNGIDASMAYGATNVRVISHAVPPTRPAFPDYLIMLPAAVVLSLGTAGLTAYATARTKGITGSSELATLYGGIKRLGTIPLLTSKNGTQFDTAIQQLLNRLLYLQREHRPKTILITSAMPQEGKTFTAVALAEAALHRGEKVFLVDADMRSGRAKRPIGIPRVGLGDVLRGEADLNDVTYRRKNLPVLPAGSPRGNPTSLLALPTLKKIMEDLARNYDLIIIDGPPTLVGGDCEMLSRIADATVFLARWNKTTEGQISAALNQLDEDRIAGMVLTMVDPGKIGHYHNTESVLYDRSLDQYYKNRA